MPKCPTCGHGEDDKPVLSLEQLEAMRATIAEVMEGYLAKYREAPVTLPNGATYFPKGY